MKILMLTWGCDGEDVSEPEVSYKWAKAISQDHDVTLFSVSRASRFGCVKEQFPELQVIEWKDIPEPAPLRKFISMAKPGYVPYYFRARSFLKKLLKSEKFDLIHQVTPHAWRYPSPAAGLGVPLVRGPIGGGLSTPAGFVDALKDSEPFYLKLRNLDTYRKRWDKIFISSFAKTERFLFVGDYMTDVVKPLQINSYSVEPEQGLADTASIRAKRPNNNEKTIFLFVGRVVRTKGVRDAIRAIANSDVRDQIEFIVVGDGDDLNACKTEANSLKLGESVTFLGRLDRAELEKFYEKADAFLFPSFREPSGGVLLEAMTHSLPIITCAYGGPNSIVDDSCGIRIPPLNENQYADELSKAITLLANDPEKRKSLSDGAANRAKGFFGWDTKRKRIAKIYEEVINAGPLN
jgi:glycosyltransferase involved in cell wall biosynthesis